MLRIETLSQAVRSRHRWGLNLLIFIVATLRNTSTNGHSKHRKCAGQRGGNRDCGGRVGRAERLESARKICSLNTLDRKMKKTKVRQNRHARDSPSTPFNWRHANVVEYGRWHFAESGHPRPTGGDPNRGQFPPELICIPPLVREMPGRIESAERDNIRSARLLRIRDHDLDVRIADDVG